MFQLIVVVLIFVFALWTTICGFREKNYIYKWMGIILLAMCSAIFYTFLVGGA